MGGITWGYNTLILSFDPNFLGHPTSSQPIKTQIADGGSCLSPTFPLHLLAPLFFFNNKKIAIKLKLNYPVNLRIQRGYLQQLPHLGGRKMSVRIIPNDPATSLPPRLMEVVGSNKDSELGEKIIFFQPPSLPPTSHFCFMSPDIRKKNMCCFVCLTNKEA